MCIKGWNLHFCFDRGEFILHQQFDIIQEIEIFNESGLSSNLFNRREEYIMNVTASRSIIREGVRSVGLSAVFLAAIFFVGCIAAIPVAVYYFETDENYVAEADARKSPDELWPEIVQLAEKAKAEGRIEILKKDDTKRLIKATDGVQTAEIKVTPRGKRESRVTIIANVPKGEEREREREQELAARIMKRLCEEAKAGCKLVEE